MEYDVVVVDTGCQCEHPKLKVKAIDGVCIIRNENGQFETSGLFFGDDVGHGTAICGIILSHVPNCNMLVIKLFDKRLFVDEESLFFALNYIYENINCKIVNLSLGIPALQNYERMVEICAKINAKGSAIIAAFDNDGSISFPAAFDNVIGVTSSSTCLKNDQYFVTNNNIVNVCAKGRTQKILWNNHKYSMGQGNSYACAHISGICVSYIKQYKKVNFNILMDLLKTKQSFEYCNSTEECVNRCHRKLNYKRVALFPFNKEMHALIRFEDMLPFEISNVYDMKYSLNIGSNTNKLLGLNFGKDHIIKKIEDINWDEIDTLVLGHMRVVSNNLIQGYDIVEHLFNEAMLRNKNIYSFDNVPEKYSSNTNFTCPDLYEDYVPIPDGKLYHQSRPVLAVFGTSSKQGKYTLQLLLRKKLIEKGYAIGQLGTEPSSELFGMEGCFHFGYDSEMKLMRYAAISCLNRILFNISKKNVDLIITGCQSETVLTQEGNLFFYPLPQIEFLYGTLPDAIVLVVNPDDEINVIQRTIMFLESCVWCKVIAIVMFPMAFETENYFAPKRHILPYEFESISEGIYEHTGIPVYLLDNDDHMENLIEIIENFFEKN